VRIHWLYDPNNQKRRSSESCLPASRYDTRDLLKIYLYGYPNGIRSLNILVYNIKRSTNILGVSDLIAKIKSWNTKYPTNGFVFIKPTYFKLYIAFEKIEFKIAA
jgi:hypothetical protein